jgi:hypothetical protein
MQLPRNVNRSEIGSAAPQQCVTAIALASDEPWAHDDRVLVERGEDSVPV